MMKSKGTSTMMFVECRFLKTVMSHATYLYCRPYPVWYPCTPNTAPNTPPSPDGMQLTCGNHAPSSDLTGFHPFETCMTLNTQDWFGRGTSFTSARGIWDYYMLSVGRGWVNTMNAPPDTTGRIPQALVDNMAGFGTALRSLLRPVSDKNMSGMVQCASSEADLNLDSPMGLVLDLGREFEFNTLLIREDLSHGQMVTSYAVDFYNDTGSSWHTFAPCTPGAPSQCLPGYSPTAPIPPVPRGDCGAVMAGVNLVFSLPRTTSFAAKVANASACSALCHADPVCNFWTWHDLTQGVDWAEKCYVRNDTVYAPVAQAGHFSGICNSSLAPTPFDGGVHGMSVGSRLFDFVPNTMASKVRLRCLSSMSPNGTAYIRSFSAHNSQPPLD